MKENTLRIVEYFTSENKEHWLSEIGKSDWGAGQFLYALLRDQKLKDTVGQTALVPMLVEGERLVSFCTLAPFDDIQPTDLSPWIGFVYTFPQYRGHRYMGRLLDYAECIAAIMEKEAVYISTGEEGLYEKYGYEFFRVEKDIAGEDSRIYRKKLAVEGEEKARRMELGGKYKSEIVAAAKKDLDMAGICGFSCNHCFLGEWCGGCRSVFNCCSYGTLSADGKCPNVKCCQEKDLDGCFSCEELEKCKTGFYSLDDDGAACKAQAIFIKKYGKELFFQVHDKLHEMYDFKKTQEILGNSVEEGLKLLEETAASFL